MINHRKAITIEVVESVLIVLLGCALFFLPAGVPRIISLVCLAVIAIYSCLEGASRIVANADRQKRLIEENKRQKESITLAKLERDKPTLPEQETPALDIPKLATDDLAGNTETVKRLVTSLFEDGSLPNSYKGYFRNIQDLLTADKYLRKFQETLSTPLIDELRHTELPLSKESKSRILNHLIQFSFIMLDYTDTYRYNINNTPEQRLNVQVAAGEVPVTEALKVARTATELPDETPNYIRVLKAAIESLDLGEEPLLLSGYKL